MDRRDELPRLIIVDITPKPASRPRCSRQGMVYTEPTYRTWLETFSALVQKQWHRKPLERVSHLEVVISGPNRRGDIDNHLKAILDGLQYAKVIRSDNLKVVDSISARFSPCKTAGPWILIKLFG